MNFSHATVYFHIFCPLKSQRWNLLFVKIWFISFLEMKFEYLLVHYGKHGSFTFYFFSLQPDQINMAVYFRYLVKCDLSSVLLYACTLDMSLFTMFKKHTAMYNCTWLTVTGSSVESIGLKSRGLQVRSLLSYNFSSTFKLVQVEVIVEVNIELEYAGTG